MNDFYVYIHRRATTGEIFYVGKGRKHRAYERGNRRSKAWQSIVARDGLLIEFVATNISEDLAFDMEESLITLVGRRDKGKGPLVNFTDGGEGTSGQIVVMTPERRANIGAAKRGTKDSPETIVKKRKAHLGKKHSPETLEKMSKIQSAREPSTFGFRPKVAVVADDTIVFLGSKDAEDWCKANGHASADRSNIVKCCKGKIRYSCNRVWRYATPNEVSYLKEKGATWAPLPSESVA